MTGVAGRGFKRALVVVFGGIGLCAGLFAEEAADRFILPETPPTIERLKKPPLDKPILKRQNFLPQSDVILPPVLLGFNFSPFYAPEYQRTVGVAAGSFGSRAGNFCFESPVGFSLRYRMFHTDGESPFLFQEQRLFAASGEHFLDDPVRITWDGQADESMVYDQDQKRYALAAGVAGYLRKNIRLGADAAYEAGRLGAASHNENGRGHITLLWQPQERHSLDVSLAGETDSAFTRDHDFTRAELLYTVEPLTAVMIGGGARYMEDVLYPQAAVTWFALHRVRVNVQYQPGIEKLSWTDTYLKNRWYAEENSQLVYPENSFALTEELSYHQGDRTTVTVRFTQQQQKGYLFWEQPAGALSATPGNDAEKALHETEIECSHRTDTVAFRLSAAARSDSDAPLVAAYRGEAEVDYILNTWTLRAGYEYTGSRLVRRNDPARLDEQGSVTAGIQKHFSQGFDVSVTVDNLAGQRLALQPGFVREQPSVTCSVTAQF